MGCEPWSKLAILHRVIMLSTIELMVAFSQAEDGHVGSEGYRTVGSLIKNQLLYSSAVGPSYGNGKWVRLNRYAEGTQPQLLRARQFTKAQFLRGGKWHEDG